MPTPPEDAATQHKGAPPYDPARNIGRLLIDAAAQMNRAVDVRARVYGISGAQWIVLIRIGGGIAQTASALCRMLGQDSGAMTRMLDRLSTRGLIQRLPSPEDGRASILALTPASEALYPQLVPIAQEVLQAHLQGFSADEIELFMGFISRLIANGAPEADALWPEAASASAF